MDSIVANVLTSLGLTGLMTLGGCYLVLSAVVGRLIRLPNVIERSHPLRTPAQRILLGTFGIVLTAPTLVVMYSYAVAGVLMPLLQPKLESVVKPSNAGLRPFTGRSIQLTSVLDRHAMPVSPAPAFAAQHLTPGMSASSRVSFAQPQSAGCDKVESFGLAQNNIRQLQYEPFKRNLHVYIGKISAFGRPSNIYILSSDDPGLFSQSGYVSDSVFQDRYARHRGWKHQETFTKSGHSVPFTFDGSVYQLKISQIYSPLFATNAVAIDICEIVNRQNVGV